MPSQSCLELFAQMVALPSASCTDPQFDQGNRAVAELLAQRCEDQGFAVSLQPLSYHPDKCNLVAYKQGRQGDEQGLALCGHLDTVPCEEAAWSTDPFRLSERNGCLHGLGSCDMKGFFPIVLEALQGIGALRQSLFLVATADEESCMGGIRELCASDQPLGRYALLGEPTGLRPVNAHKGVLMEKLRLIGRSAHSSEPDRGHSALEGMHRVISALLDWRRELRQNRHHEDFPVPEPTLNLGSIHGGDSANRVCGSCELQLDLRLLPDMAPETMRRQLRARAADAVAEIDGVRLEHEALFRGLPAMMTRPDTKIVRLAERLSHQRCGSVCFATEGGFLNARGMQTVILGPGDIAQAHCADEYLPLDRIQPMIEIVQALVSELCVKEQAG